MSGQPVKTASDQNRFRNEYLETLALQEQINDMNLQANKTYLLTGQLPPQSQMQDTRTTAEKLKDSELMKQSIAKDLAPIAEPSFAYAIVNAVQQSPLNVNNSLLRFLAQRASSIAESLSKSYKFGISGDANDLEIIVEFIKNMYSDTQGKFQSMKSYISSQSSQGTKNSVLSSNDIDVLITDFTELIRIITMVKDTLPVGFNRYVYDNVVDKVNRVEQMLLRAKRILPTTNQIKLLMDDLTGNPEEYAMYGIEPYNQQDMTLFFDLLEKLPKSNQMITLFNKAKKFANLRDFNSLSQTLSNVESSFSIINDLNIPNLQPMINIVDRQRAKEDISRRQQETQLREEIRNQREGARDASKATKVYIVNPEDDPGWVQFAGGNPPPGGNAPAGGNAPIADAGAVNIPPGGIFREPPRRIPVDLDAINDPEEIQAQAADFVRNMRRPRGDNLLRFDGQGRRLPDLNIDNVINELNDDIQRLAIPPIPGGNQPPQPADLPRPAGVNRPQPDGRPNMADVFAGIANPIRARQIDALDLAERERAERERAAFMANRPPIEIYTEAIRPLVNALTADQLTQFENEWGVNMGARPFQKREYVLNRLVQEFQNRDVRDNPYGIGGLGIKRRVGRPRGMGIVKPIRPKVPTFVGFGINEINQKQLEKGILKIRRNTKSNYTDMPSKHISNNLQNIIKTIIGGGVPKYDELGKLDSEEKDYLHKLISRSNLTDRLSVPAPSKDQQEKDIHNFEVMKGQIMSGNDSQELVKKFKLLVRKLSKQGLLPKNDVEDILDTLTDLGY